MPTRENSKNKDKTGEILAGLFGDVLTNVTEVSGYYTGVPQAEAAAMAQSATAQAEAAGQASIASAVGNAVAIVGVTLAVAALGSIFFLSRK